MSQAMDRVWLERLALVGLALFHPAVGLVTLLALRRARWLGAATLALSVALGVVT
ncbi:MAG: hypothetical protein HYU25_11615 [Candidatus Rokubacteria bacterium]|nr:hypothetical protein [Candidatus Rokubacteria bacterium]